MKSDPLKYFPHSMVAYAIGVLIFMIASIPSRKELQEMHKAREVELQKDNLHMTMLKPLDTNLEPKQKDYGTEEKILLDFMIAVAPEICRSYGTAFSWKVAESTFSHALELTKAYLTNKKQVHAIADALTAASPVA